MCVLPAARVLLAGVDAITVHVNDVLIARADELRQDSLLQLESRHAKVLRPRNIALLRGPRGSRRMDGWAGALGSRTGTRQGSSDASMARSRCPPRLSHPVDRMGWPGSPAFVREMQWNSVVLSHCE